MLGLLRRGWDNQYGGVVMVVQNEVGGEGREAGRAFVARGAVWMCHPEKQSNFPKVTQLLRGKDRTRTQTWRTAASFPPLPSQPPCEAASGAIMAM